MANCMDCGGSECVCELRRILADKEQELAMRRHGAQPGTQICSVEEALHHERDEHLRLIGDLLKANEQLAQGLLYFHHSPRIVDRHPNGMYRCGICGGECSIRERIHHHPECPFAALNTPDDCAPPVLKLGPDGSKIWP